MAYLTNQILSVTRGTLAGQFQINQHSNTQKHRPDFYLLAYSNRPQFHIKSASQSDANRPRAVTACKHRLRPAMYSNLKTQAFPVNIT